MNIIFNYISDKMEEDLVFLRKKSCYILFDHPAYIKY